MCRCLLGRTALRPSAYDGKGFSSNQESVDVVSTVPGTQKPNLWVLSVGVSAYPKLAAQWQLDYAHSDANALVKALRGATRQNCSMTCVIYRFFGVSHGWHPIEIYANRSYPHRSRVQALKNRIR